MANSSLRMQKKFSGGVNTYDEPQNLGDYELAKADHVQIIGGVPRSRPGFVGLFAYPFSPAKPLWELYPFVRADKTTNILFAAGGNGDASLYTTVKGSSTKTAVTGSPTTLSGPNTRIDRAGSKAYVVDGVSAITVVNLEASPPAFSYVAETAPATAPSPAVLTNESLDNFAASPTPAGTWVADTFTGSGVNVLTSAQTDINAHTSGNISGAVGTQLVAIGTSPSIQTADGTKGIPAIYANIPTAAATNKWLTLDDPGDGVTTLTGASSNASPTLDAPNADRKCCQFYMAAYDYTSDPTSKQGVKFTLKAYSDAAATVLVGILTYTFVRTFAGQAPGQLIEHIFSFVNTDSNIVKVVGEYTAADGNTNAASRSNFEGFVYLAGLVLAPIQNNVSFTQNANSFGLVHTETTPAYWGAWGGIRLTKTYTADQSLTNKSTIAFALAPAGANTLKQLVDGGMRFKLGFRANGASALTDHKYSNDLLFAADYSYMYVDVSTVDATVLGAYRRLEIVSLSDIAVTATTSPLMVLGPLTFSGNLSVGLPYAWVVTAINNQGDSTFVGIIESDSSPQSVTLTPTGFQAEGKLTLPALDVTATHYGLYRYYGVFASTDGVFPLARLIAYLPVGSNTVDPLSPGIGYVTWNHTTKVVIDDTPDGSLFGVPTLITGKTPPPVGASCLASWMGRLWLAKGSDVYGSWLLNASDAGLYFGPAQDPINDPSAPIKGYYQTVGGADHDDILALMPFGTVLLIIKEQSVWQLTGPDGAQFQLYPHMQKSGIGTVGLRGTANVTNRAWLLTSTGPFRYDSGEEAVAMGQQIEPYFAPQMSGGPKIPGTIMKYASMLYAARRVYICAPSTEDSTANDCMYVFDTRDGNQGWVRWPGQGLTSGCTTSAINDSDEVYFGGYDGQLYQLTGYQDIPVPGDDPVPITSEIISRGFGQEDADNSYWAANIPSIVKASVQPDIDADFVTTVYAAGTTVVDAHTFTVPGGRPDTMRFPDVSQAVQGDYVQVGVAVTTTDKVIIRAVGIHTAEGKVDG